MIDCFASYLKQLDYLPYKVKWLFIVFPVFYFGLLGFLQIVKPLTKSAQQTMIYFSLENSLLNFVLFNIALEVLLMSGFLLPHTANIQILEKRANSKPLCINYQYL